MTQYGTWYGNEMCGRPAGQCKPCEHDELIEQLNIGRGPSQWTIYWPDGPEHMRESSGMTQSWESYYERTGLIPDEDPHNSWHESTWELWHAEHDLRARVIAWGCEAN